MDKYYTASMIMTVVTMVIMLISVKFNIGLSKKQRQASAILFGLIVVGTVCEWSGVLLDGKSAVLIPLHIFVKTIELSLAPFIGLMCGRIFSTSRWEKRIFWLLSFNVVLEVISAFSGMIFYVDAANSYHHGPLYIIYLLSYALGIVYFIGRGIRISKQFQSKHGLPILLVVLFAVGCIITQLIDSEIRIDWIAISISAIMLYKFYGDMLLQMDGLTGLLNHWSFEHTIQNLSKEAIILFFDVDQFKEVNDQYGHLVGDACLEKVASGLKKTYGNDGMCFRYGGDEFCVIMTHSLNHVDKRIQKFYHILNGYQKSEEWMPSVSVGYAAFDPKKDTIQEVTRRADERMYKDKEHKR